MQLYVYMFHYIKNKESNAHNKFLFRKKFYKFFRFNSARKILKIDQKYLLEENSNQINGKILFTFDDGLKEHYSFV